MNKNPVSSIWIGAGHAPAISQATQVQTGDWETKDNTEIDSEGLYFGASSEFPVIPDAKPLIEGDKEAPAYDEF